MLLCVVPPPQFFLSLSLNLLCSRCLLLPELSGQPHYLQPALPPLPSSIPDCDPPFLPTAALPQPLAGAVYAAEHLPDRVPPCGADWGRSSPVPSSAVGPQLQLPAALCTGQAPRKELAKSWHPCGSVLWKGGGMSHNLRLLIWYEGGKMTLGTYISNSSFFPNKCENCYLNLDLKPRTSWFLVSFPLS